MLKLVLLPFLLYVQVFSVDKQGMDDFKFEQSKVIKTINLSEMYKEQEKKNVHALLTAPLPRSLYEEEEEPDWALMYEEKFGDELDDGSGEYEALAWSENETGKWHIEQYDKEANNKSLEKPTSSMLINLKNGLLCFERSASFVGDEIAENAIPDIKKVYFATVRWYIYFNTNTPTLVKEIYNRDFIISIIDQAEKIYPIIQKTKYDGSNSCDDLASFLISLGFKGINQNNHTQHNWVNQNGIMVRVKNKGEVTIGVTLQNPIDWQKNCLKDNNNNTKIAFDQNNEILKIVYHSGAIFVIPPFFKNSNNYWWFKGGNVKQKQYNMDMMQLAHLQLKNIDLNKVKQYIQF